MSHATTFKPHTHHADAEDIPRRAKVLYVLIVVALLAAAIAFIAERSISSSFSNNPNTVQQNSNAANSGTTKETGAPTKDTGTSKDRVNPSPSGGGGNTMLNPEQPQQTPNF